MNSVVEQNYYQQLAGFKCRPGSKLVTASVWVCLNCWRTYPVGIKQCNICGFNRATGRIEPLPDDESGKVCRFCGEALIVGLNWPNWMQENRDYRCANCYKAARQNRKRNA